MRPARSLSPFRDGSLLCTTDCRFSFNAFFRTDDANNVMQQRKPPVNLTIGPSSSYNAPASVLFPARTPVRVGRSCVTRLANAPKLEWAPRPSRHTVRTPLVRILRMMFQPNIRCARAGLIVHILRTSVQTRSMPVLPATSLSQQTTEERKSASISGIVLRDRTAARRTSL